jgi:hypothetical protein
LAKGIACLFGFGGIYFVEGVLGRGFGKGIEIFQNAEKDSTLSGL